MHQCYMVWHVVIPFERIMLWSYLGVNHWAQAHCNLQLLHVLWHLGLLASFYPNKCENSTGFGTASTSTRWRLELGCPTRMKLESTWMLLGFETSMSWNLQWPAIPSVARNVPPPRSGLGEKRRDTHARKAGNSWEFRPFSSTMRSSPWRQPGGMMRCEKSTGNIYYTRWCSLWHNTMRYNTPTMLFQDKIYTNIHIYIYTYM